VFTLQCFDIEAGTEQLIEKVERQSLTVIPEVVRLPKQELVRVQRSSPFT
jgi:hypothetical protein